MRACIAIQMMAELKLPSFNLRCIVSDKRALAIRWRDAWLAFKAAEADSEAACFRSLHESQIVGLQDGPARAARGLADTRKAAAPDALMNVPAPRRDDIAMKIKAAGQYALSHNQAWQAALTEDEARMRQPSRPRKIAPALSATNPFNTEA